jgi:DNA-binding MarR family transcriptional regulator
MLTTMNPPIIQLRKSIALLQVSMNRIVGKDKGKKDEISSIGISILHFSYHRKMRMSDIARIHNVSKSTATDYIDNLERRGYVRRMKSEDDLRDVFIEPTSKGRKWVEGMNQMIHDYIHEGLSRLDPEEQHQFIALLSKFVGISDDIPYDEVMENLMKRPITADGNGSKSASMNSVMKPEDDSHND